MKSCIELKRFLHCGLFSAGLSLVLSAHAAQFKFPTQTLTVPDGFEVELVAGPPLVERPVSADFDEQGRLYVTDSSGSNDKVQKQLEDKPHRVLRLDAVNAEGRFEKSSVFADKIMFPEGAMWLDGSLYVAAPPSIWKFTDTNGDGVADQRAEWFQGKTLTGCANDLHGPYAGPDGWIYWCKGAFAKQTYERPGQSPFVTRAAHIFRCRPDGSGLEPVMTGGMDNPVEVAFSPGGERFFTTTFLVHPEAGKRDGIIHAIYGGVYGKDHDVIEDHKRTGDLMPVLTHLGPAAACGLMRYSSAVFGPEFQDNLFATCFNLHKVTRHVLEPEGATFRTRDSDFLVSDSPDFHPTHVLEDADGSLLVIDTGGWYKICCPTSQLYKPDVLGAIYRVRRKNAPTITDPWGTNLGWGKMSAGELAGLLGDARPAVSNRAIRELAKKPQSALPALSKIVKDLSKGIPPGTAGTRGAELHRVNKVAQKEASAKRNAVWALARIDNPQARAMVRNAIIDSDDSVWLAAIHSASIWRDAGAIPRLQASLEAGSASVQRAAAEAIGRLGEKSAVPVLLSVASTPHDRVLEHSLIYALIEINDPAGTADGLSSVSVHTKKAALIALDQMDNSTLKPEQVTPFLADADPGLRAAAGWVVSHHPQWGSVLVDFFRERLSRKDLSSGDQVELEKQLALFARNDAIQTLLANTLARTDSRSDNRLRVLHAMAQAALKEIPATWKAPLASCLTEREEGIVRAAIAVLRSVPASKTNSADFTQPLLRLAADAKRTPELRLEALTALPGSLKAVEPQVFQFLCANLSPEEPLARRSAAAGIIGKAHLGEPQLLQLCEKVSGAGPLELSKLLGAFERAPNESIGLKFVAALKESKALASIPPASLLASLTNFPASVRAQGEQLAATLNLDAPQQKQHLEEIAASLKEGDVRRGQTIFNSQKTACSTCHAIGYLGGHVGPDLTRIGQVRTERDLLESIVYPSASFVRSYEPLMVETKSGEVYSGIVRKDNAEEVLLVTGPEAEVRVPRTEIAGMRPGTVSLMPAGLDEQLSRQELADLLAFLKSTKW
jgi:putative membrane-bound dehydrogenase-like protein